jgi:hypothetical protein
MEEFDIDIVHRPGRRHGNVDGLTRAYEGVGDVSEDDNFLDAAIMSINAEEALEEYREIILYLDGMRFPDGATKAIRTRIVHKSRNYSMIGNQLYFQGRDGVLRRTIGKHDTSHLLYEFHDGFYGGHFAGRIIVKKILQASYYWPTLFKDAHDYCRSCDVCQAYAQRSTISGPLHPIPPLTPFEKWGVDLMGPLPMTRRGHRFIVVATYYLTKFSEVHALKSSMKQEIAQFLYERVFTRFGSPLEIVSNIGPQFLSEVMENLLTCLAMNHMFTTMYKPNTNGIVERTIGHYVPCWQKRQRFM